LGANEAGPTSVEKAIAANFFLAQAKSAPRQISAGALRHGKLGEAIANRVGGRLKKYFSWEVPPKKWAKGSGSEFARLT